MQNFYSVHTANFLRLTIIQEVVNRRKHFGMQLKCYSFDYCQQDDKSLWNLINKKKRRK